MIKLREDRPAMQDEHAALRKALLLAKEKLALYRAAHGGEYVGGLEYTALVKLIDDALDFKRTLSK